MKLLTHIPAWLKSKYTISSGIFLAVILFFDKNDFFTRQARDKELNDLAQSKAWYQKEIEVERTELKTFKNNPATIEQYAREKYLMKKENEDLYIIPEKTTEKAK